MNTMSCLLLPVYRPGTLVLLTGWAWPLLYVLPKRDPNTKEDLLVIMKGRGMEQWVMAANLLDYRHQRCYVALLDVAFFRYQSLMDIVAVTVMDHHVNNW